jgi:predicted peptidase
MVLILWLLPQGGSGAETTAEARSSFEKATHGTLPYRLSSPKLVEGQRYPLVVFLHGYYQRGTDNEAQLAIGAAEFASRPGQPAFVLAPQCPSTEKWIGGNIHQDPYRAAEEPTASLQSSLDLVRKLGDELPIDPGRIYVVGLSMGAFGAIEAMQREPDLFAAAILLAGSGDRRLGAPIAEIPMWFFHGERDRKVPVGATRGFVAVLRGAGGSPRYTEFADTGHVFWDRVLSDPEIYSWLFSQRR